MQERQSIIRRAISQIAHQPVLVLFGIVASIGGILNVFLVFGLNASVSGILLLDGLHIVGRAFLVHVVAFTLGFLLAFLVILAISGFAQSIILKVAGAHFHKEDDVWYGAFRIGSKAMIPLMSVWVLFYVCTLIFVGGLYRVGLLAISAVRSPIAVDVIALCIIILTLFIVMLFAAVALNASCFVSIFRLKTGKALAAGFDLFARIPMRSIGLLLLLGSIWLLVGIGVAVAYGILTVLCIWIARFGGVSPAHLAAFIVNGLSNGGLLSILFLGILLLTIATLTAFGDTAWTLFFLEHVSTDRLPKKSARQDDVSSVMPEAEAI